MPFFVYIAVLALVRASWSQPADPGFAQDADPGNARRLAGRWINEFLFARGDETPQRFWQIVEYARNGQTAHDYFSSDPRLQIEPIPYTRVVSTWTVGTFVDPQADKGQVAVIRIQPSTQINYDDVRMRYQHFSGNFGPQFRRFALAAADARLSLSELVVLEVPGNIFISFPDDARNMLFERLPDPPSAVHDSGWGQLKKTRATSLKTIGAPPTLPIRQ